MDYSVFLKILFSWEVIVAIVCVMIVLPVAFFLASLDKKPVMIKKKVIEREIKKENRKEKKEDDKEKVQEEDE